MTQSTVFVLGGDDAEMAAIRALLAAGGHTVLQATKDGKAVHGGNAYEANGLSASPGELGPDDTVVLVECDLPGFWCGDPQPRIVRIDHHRPGDPGYGRPPEEFLLASSIGQVHQHLEGSEFKWQAAGGATDQPAWFIVGPDQHGRFVPQAVLLTAAADHCLGHAYAGRCPGVNPDALLRHRAAEKAAFQKRPVEAVLADIEAAREVLRTASLRTPDGRAFQPSVNHTQECSDGTPHFGCEGCTEDSVPTYRDLTTCPRCGGSGAEPLEQNVPCHGPFCSKGTLHVPELPEAAARYGFAYLATVTEPTGRVKDVLGGAVAPEVVREWMEEMRRQGRQVYGDPERGFAGAYR